MTRLLSYPETVSLFERVGISLASGCLVTDLQAALEVASQITYPVVLKVVSPDQTHKTDAGLVCLSVQSDARLEQGWSALEARSAGLSLEGILVQKMASPGLEVIVGVQHDAQFGPVVVVGLGGALVHLLDEVALRLPPITRLEVAELFAETRLGRLLAGVRGAPPADIPALTDLIQRVGQLAAAGLPLASLDLNPVIVHPQGQGISIVDARVFMEGEG